MEGAIGINPSHERFDDHGSCESSAESAMQPPRSAPAKTASAILVSEYCVILVELVL